MRVWIVNVGEPMAVDPGAERKLRMGLIADRLAERGHDVVWWTSSFDHNYKRQRYESDTTVRVSDRIELRFLRARAYSSNISIGRLVNHHQLGRAFERVAEATTSEERPDVIFATMPIVELAAAAARYGASHDIPVIIDVRDLHPDIYLNLVPRSIHPVARIAMSRMYRDLKTSLRLATGVIAIAPSFLRWGLAHGRRQKSDRDAVFPLAYPEIHASASELELAKDELRSMGVREDKKILWYVGTFNRWIDLETPIHAARALAKAGEDEFQLVISGSGDFDEQWRRQARGLENVVFTGWIGVPHIIHLRAAAWAGLAPYRSGFLTVGNKLFEYMAGSLPVLLSIGGDAKDIIESTDSGIAYVGGNPKSLVDAIHRLDIPGVRARMAANSRKAYEQHYSASKVYGDLTDYIESFVSGAALVSR
jgi:glycosyltransferase involved in cell wall biosynthesis